MRLKVKPIEENIKQLTKKVAVIETLEKRVTKQERANSSEQLVSAGASG